jgi:hypothetical protein
MKYVNTMVQPTQILCRDILYVLKIIVRLRVGGTGWSIFTGYLGLPVTPSTVLLQNYSNHAPKQCQCGAVTPTFEYRTDTVVVAAEFWREVVVEKPHISGDHRDYA